MRQKPPKMHLGQGFRVSPLANAVLRNPGRGRPEDRTNCIPQKESARAYSGCATNDWDWRPKPDHETGSNL